MKKTIYWPDFRKAFEDMDRINAWSYDGLKALYDYLIEIEFNNQEEFELDVIDLCGNYTEYESLVDFQSDYGEEDFPDIEAIKYCSPVIPINGSDGFIIENF